MKFTDIAKECPDTWEDFINKLPYDIQKHQTQNNFFLKVVGYLILDYLPSKGIEIERRVDIYNGNVWYSVKWKEPIGGALNFYHKKTFDTLEEAIVKAFQIIEEKL